LLEWAITGIVGGINVCQCTKDRANRYMCKYHDSDIAIQAALENNHSFSSKFLRAALSAIPIYGIPQGILYPIWRKLRDIALIASINGYDVESKEIQYKILQVFFLINPTALPTALSQGCTLAIVPVTETIVENNAYEFLAKKQAEHMSLQVTRIYHDVGYWWGSFFSEGYAVQSAQSWEATAIDRFQHPMFIQNMAHGLKETISVKSVEGIVEVVTPVAVYATAIPITLLVNWLFDNSDKIFNLAKVVFCKNPL